MERDFETNSSHYCSSRTALWCPICGAKENQGCKPVDGVRFESHNNYALGTVPRPVITTEPWESPTKWGNGPAPKGKGDRPKWTPKNWVN